MGASGLGSLLVKEGLLTEQDRQTINKTCGQGSWAFAKSVLTMGLLDEEELAAFVAERTRFRVAAKNFLKKLDLEISHRIDRHMCSRLEILPLALDANKLTVAVADPLDKATLVQLEFFTGLEIIPIIAPLSQIYEGLTRLNPEFVPRFTALSNFLRNHAGGAWVKQKLGEPIDDFDEEQPREKGSKKSGISKSVAALDDDDDLSLEARTGGLDEDGPEDDFSGADFDDIDDDLDPQLTHSEAGDGLDDLQGDRSPIKGSPSKASAASETSEDDIWGDGLDDLELENAPQPLNKGTAKALEAIDDMNLDSTLDGADLDDLDAFDSMSLDGADELAPSTRPAEGDLGDLALEDDFAASDSPLSPVTSGGATGSDFFGDLSDELGDSLESAAESKATENSVTPQNLPESDSSSDDFEFAAEEDPLDAFDGLSEEDESSTPSSEALPSDVLLASLDKDVSEDIDSAPAEEFAPDIDEGFMAKESENRPGVEVLKASLASDVSDLIEEPDSSLDTANDDDTLDFESEPEPESTFDLEVAPDEASLLRLEPAELMVQRTVTQTALVNEILLRISLCFNEKSLLDLLQEHIPLLSPAGCLLLFNGSRPISILWEQHKLLAAQSDVDPFLDAVQLLMDQSPEGSWQTLAMPKEIGLSATYEECSLMWKKLASGVPGGLWLGQHDLQDYAFVEAIESLLLQIVAKLDQGGLKVG